KHGELGQNRKPAAKNIALDFYFFAFDASSETALRTAAALTGAPCALASESAAAQSASLARPGSIKAKRAAKGERKPRPAPTTPCVMAGLASTPSWGDWSLPVTVIGAFNRTN